MNAYPFYFTADKTTYGKFLYNDDAYYSANPFYQTAAITTSS